MESEATSRGMSRRRPRPAWKRGWSDPLRPSPTSPGLSGFMPGGLAVRRGSIRVRADHFAAIDRAERLPDADPGRGAEDPHRLVPCHADGVACAGVERPGLDRILDEPDRAVHEGDIGPAGVEARDAVDERAGLV